MLADGKRRIRVLTLVDGTGSYGGGERLAREIATHLDPDRFEVTFCVSRPVPAPELAAARAAVEPAGVRLAVLRRGGRADLRPWLAAAAEFRRLGVDLVHSHKFGSNVWAALLKGRLGSPRFVAHEHTWSFEGHPERRLLDRWLIGRRADAFVAVSGPDRRRMIEEEGIDAAKVRLIANGIPDPPPPDPSHDLRAELGIPETAPLLGTVATLRPQKALGVMIAALAELRLVLPDAQLLIAGGEGGFSGERAKLEAAAQRLGVAAEVHLLGPRDDVPDLLATLDLALVSSEFEGSPLSVMEYMEAALPVVATAVGGIPEVVVDGVTGILVPPRDPTAMAAAAVELLQDRSRAAALGEAGRRRRREHFSVAATTVAVERLYEELVGAGVGGTH